MNSPDLSRFQCVNIFVLKLVYLILPALLRGALALKWKSRSFLGSERGQCCHLQTERWLDSFCEEQQKKLPISDAFLTCLNNLKSISIHRYYLQTPHLHRNCWLQTMMPLVPFPFGAIIVPVIRHKVFGIDSSIVSVYTALLFQHCIKICDISVSLLSLQSFGLTDLIRMGWPKGRYQELTKWGILFLWKHRGACYRLVFG